MDGLHTGKKVKNRNNSSSVSAKKKKKASKTNGKATAIAARSDDVPKKKKTIANQARNYENNDTRNKSSPTLQKDTSNNYDDDGDDQVEEAPRRQQQRQLYQPLQLHELPDIDDMMAFVTKDIRNLKLECKRLFQDMEQAKKETDAVTEEAIAVRRKSQIEKLQGNELIKVDHLLRLGFDEDIIRDHLKEQNKVLEKEYSMRQRDVKNLESNISKMTAMNKECEKAVTAAHGAFGQLVVRQQALQAKLQQAELELYSVEAKVKHKRNMKSVEFTNKDKFKNAMKEIVKEVQKRCKDGKLTRDVLKVAGLTMSTDLGMKESDFSSDDTSDSGSTNSSDLSSVDVSSVESDG